MEITLVTSIEELLVACADYQTVGFHGTSSVACEEIETNGFLPKKVISESDHAKLLSIASSLSIDTSSYKEWLDMRSVTFAKQADAAVSHVQRSAGGQGLHNVQQVLSEILNLGNDQQKETATAFVNKLETIRKAPSVVYAVSLADLGPRLVNDKHQPLYQYYHPSLAVSEFSDIGRDRLIAKLSLSS